jgi:hypothetical protein
MEHRSKGLPGRARTARGADSPPRITAWLYYIDTLRVAFRAPLSPAEGRELVRLNRIPWQRANLITYGTRYRYAIVLSPMPQPEALRFLASTCASHQHLDRPGAGGLHDDLEQAGRYPAGLRR